MKPRRSHKQDRLAKLYDAEILPIWSERFGRMLLRRLSLPAKSMILDVGSGTGYPALAILRKMDEGGRVISIDPSSAMLDVAREKAGSLGGRRIFFRTESAEPRLSFADDVYDRVVCNLTLQEMERPAAMACEFARVCQPGGSVLATFPLAGTYAEFYDLLREVLLHEDRKDALDRLDRHLLRTPTVERARAWFERAGLLDVEVEQEEFELVFRSSREFFFAPVIEYGPLADWKEVAGKGEEMQSVFRAVKEAIDSYFAGSTFALTVRAGLALGRKPLEDEKRALAEAAEEAAELETPTGEFAIGSSEIELVDESVIAGPISDDELVEDEEEEELDVHRGRR